MPSVRFTAFVCVVSAAVLASCSSEPAAPVLDGGVALDAGATSDAGSADDAAALDAGPGDAGATDLDLDGLDDAEELRLASEYLPYFSVSDTDACPRSGIIFRMRPHPDDAGRIAVTMVVLYENDCGAGGHVGDDEVFGMTIDPATPAPAGILAIRTIAHQNTACEAITGCGTCAGFSPCTTGTRRGVAYPAIFASRDKHGWYATEAECDNACFFTNQCELSSAPAEPMLLNAGEPGAPLTNDLTASGLITAAGGWTETSLMNFDPWASMNFGGAGDTTSDLTDAAFLTPSCR